MFKVMSLFAGCGGSSVGYQMAQGKVLAAVEFDPHAAQMYLLNHPQTRLLEQDIQTLAPEDLLAELGLEPGELDILDGSPPCQGFSTAGKRVVQDPRNRLFEEYVRFLRVIQPKAFVMENVPGLVSGKMKPLFFRMIDTLRASGYEVRARILNAADYGVPQARRRVIVLGLRSDLNLIPVHPAPFTPWLSFRRAVQDLEDPGLIAYPKGQALLTAQALRAGESGNKLHQRFGQKGNEFSLIRLRWDKSAPTVCKTIRPGQCGLLDPEEDRFLGINELKRVCSFPDAFVLSGSFEQQWGRLGNAVPPLLTKAIAEQLILSLRGGSHA